MGMNVYAPVDLEVLTVMSQFPSVEVILAVTKLNVSKFPGHLNANVKMVGLEGSAK